MAGWVDEYGCGQTGGSLTTWFKASSMRLTPSLSWLGQSPPNWFPGCNVDEALVELQGRDGGAWGTFAGPWLSTFLGAHSPT